MSDVSLCPRQSGALDICFDSDEREVEQALMRHGRMSGVATMSSVVNGLVRASLAIGDNEGGEVYAGHLETENYFVVHTGTLTLNRGCS